MDVKDPLGQVDGRSADDDVRDLAGGAIVVFVGKLARASRGAFLWVVTLLCGLDVVGLYSLAWAVCSTLNKVARFGLLRSVVYFVAEARSADQEREAKTYAAIASGVWIALLAAAAVVLAVQLSAGWLAAFYENPIERALRIMSWTAPFIALSWVFTSATRALRIMRYEVYVRSVAGPLVLFVGGAAVGLAGYGLEAVAWVQLLMAVGNLSLSLYYFRRHFSLGLTLRALPRPGLRGRMARFGLPVSLSDLLYALLVQLDVLMLGRFVEDIALAGIYVMARRVASTVLKAPQAFDAIFSSIVSDLSVQQRHEELGDRFVTVARWILLVNLPIAVCLVLVGDPILQVLGASQLRVAADLEIALQVLLVLCVGMMVQSVFAVAEPLLAMSGRPTLNLLNNIVWLGVNFGLNLWLIDAYGILGAAAGAAASMLLVNLMRMVEVYVVRGIAPFHRSQIKPLVAGAIAALPTWFAVGAVEHALGRALLPCGIFLLVYAVALLGLRLEAEDRMLLGRMGRAVRRRVGG
jgi:O-antigen/teichoic acid export membrane protein